MKRQKQKSHMHNYMRKLKYLTRVGALPSSTGLHMIDILHDRWCGIYRQQRCNCDPTIKLKVSVPMSMN